VRIDVDHDRCEGHGLCEDKTPAVFAVDDEGRVTHHFQGAEIPDEHVEEARAAAAVCPVAALRAV
jgi:ferredoxin